MKRLRPLPDADALAAMYPTPHDHRMYGRGHHERVEATIELGRRHLPINSSVADLSCGNGEIARRIAPDGNPILGDFADGHPICGPIEDTIQQVGQVEVWVLSETLEHLDTPAAVLAAIRERTIALVLSTPLECWGDSNAEHLWAWDRAGVEGLLSEAGFDVVDFTSVDSRDWGEPYLYGIWLCQ